MTKHLFSSGEIMFGKNRKELAEGVFIGDYLQYGDVEPETEYICVGKLETKLAQIRFAIDENDFMDVKSRHALKILMQSDIFSSKWKKYNIEFSDSE
jgi:hypothetical protein